ncbi:MAG: nucleotidyltransferase family protein [Candidatus Omnitrophica bacterium]|nr:nucleotidyltransferase family protein [Candidatus Omnitrophota bacterium]MDD5487554.1 nucleotidyltransferase family protein [Candidatus Omnitrophota bacterium]
MKGLILAAGYGTRLYPLTLDRPKPLVKVGGKTILERLLRKMESMHGCDEIYIVTNDKFHSMVNQWVAGRNFSVKITVIDDMTKSNEDRLGAIGDINLVVSGQKPDEDVVIVAGDNLFEFAIHDFISFAREKKKLCVALFDVKDLKMAQRYGIVSLDGESKVVAFEEKPASPKSTLASTGIYYFPKDKLPMLEEYMGTGLVKDAPGNFVKWVSEKDEVYGFVFTEGWYDIGDKNSLEKADIEYRQRELSGE